MNKTPIKKSNDRYIYNIISNYGFPYVDNKRFIKSSNVKSHMKTIIIQQKKIKDQYQ